MNQDYKERFLRNIGIMDEAGLQKIKDTSIAIGGMGLGGSIFLNLVRMGFEKFHVADPDIYERTNINRQRMAKETTVGVRKDDALVAEALEINSDVQIRCFREGVTSENVNAFLEGMDWVVDVIDVFAIPAKLALNAEARRRGLPVVSCGTIGFAASVVVFNRDTPSFAELSGMSEAQSFDVNMERFVRFICPRVPEYMAVQVEKALRGESHIPFIAPGVEMTASFAASEIVKHVLGLGKFRYAPQGIHIDCAQLNIEAYDVSYLVGDEKRPAQLSPRSVVSDAQATRVAKKRRSAA